MKKIIALCLAMALLLGIASVVHDLFGVQHINLLGEAADSGLLGRGETAQIQLLGNDFFLLLFSRGFLHSGGSLGHRIQGEIGDEAVLFVHGILPFCQISKSLLPARPSLASIVFITSMSVSISSAWFSNNESNRFL